MRYSKRTATKLPDKKLKIGVSYDRISTDDQRRDRNGNIKKDGSPEAQKARCAAYIKHVSLNTGVEHKVIDQLSDKAFSGKNIKRPDFQKLLKLISEKKIDFVVAADISRLSRSVVDFLNFVSHCEVNNVDIHVIGMNLDTSSPQGRLMLTIVIALAQFERELTSVRVKANNSSRLITDGKINGAAPILGLDRDSENVGHFTINSDEVFTAEKLLRLYVSHASKKKTLAEAKRLGITGKSGKGLTPHMLEQVLKNVQWRYRGLWYVNDGAEQEISSKIPESEKHHIVQLPHGQVIQDTKLLDAVQFLLDDPKHKLKRTGSDGYTYIFSRILEFEDGTKFTGECAKGRQYRYYRNHDINLRVHCDQVDHCVIKTLKAHLLDDSRFTALVADTIKRRDEELPRIDRALQSFRRELSDFEASIATARQRMMDSQALPTTVEVWASEFERNQRLKAQKEAEIERLKDQRVEILSKNNLTDLRKTAVELLKRFDKLPGPQKRSTIERLVKKITIHEKDEITIEMYGEPSTAERGVETLRKKVRLEGKMAPQDGLEPPTQ